MNVLTLSEGKHIEGNVECLQLKKWRLSPHLYNNSFFVADFFVVFDHGV